MRLTVPNVLTIFRFGLIPVFVWVFFFVYPLAALAVFMLACLSDILDGRIARRTHTESVFGKWADPVADKVMTLSVIMCLVTAKYLPWVFLVFYAVKELLTITGGLVVYFGGSGQKKMCSSRPVGKLAMVLTFCGLLITFFRNYAPWHIHIIVMWVAVGANITSTVYYYLYYYKDTEA